MQIKSNKLYKLYENDTKQYEIVFRVFGVQKVYFLRK
jgi:hypothetical protein